MALDQIYENKKQKDRRKKEEKEKEEALKKKRKEEGILPTHLELTQGEKALEKGLLYLMKKEIHNRHPLGD